jgi:uncharacterized membrane protein
MRYVLLVLALAGVIVSSLALKVHYDTGTEPCSINEHWDCGVVNHSSFAMMGSVPIATIGIAGYLLLGVLALLRQRFVLLLAVFAAFCFALRLTFIEEYALMVWCLYCVVSQAIIAIMLLLSIGWLASEYFGLKRRTRGAA